MRGYVEECCELELFSLIVRLIYEVGSVAVGLHVSLQPRFEYVFVKFSEESTLTLECVVVYI